MAKRKTILGIPKCGQEASCAPYAPLGCSASKFSNFEPYEVVFATAYRLTNMIFPVEVIIAAKSKKELAEAMKAMGFEYDASKARLVRLLPNAEAHALATEGRR